MGGMTDADPSTSRDAPGGAGEGAPHPGAPGAPRASGASGATWARAAVSFERWMRGDPRAVDDLVRTMTPVLWQVVRAYGLDSLLAEDVVQATWLTLVRRRAAIRDPQAIAGWLITTARREAWRSGRAQQRLRPVEPADLEPALEPEASAEETVHLDDRDRRLWAAVRSLDERCRRLLRVVAFDERPDYAYIARDLDMPIGSIGPTRGRCLGKLRSALEADGWRGDPRGR